jgi:hypothetical protein
MGLLKERPALTLAGAFVASFVVSFALMWRARGPAAVSADPPPSDAAVAEETDAAGPMPLGINVYHRHKGNPYQGYVQNTSPKLLSVTLEVVGADGRANSTLRLELSAWERKDFNNDSGLDMHSNDQIVVHSDPYPDVTVQVP